MPLYHFSAFLQSISSYPYYPSINQHTTTCMHLFVIKSKNSVANNVNLLSKLFLQVIEFTELSNNCGQHWLSSHVQRSTNEIEDKRFQFVTPEIHPLLTLLAQHLGQWWPDTLQPFVSNNNWRHAATAAAALMQLWPTASISPSVHSSTSVLTTKQGRRTWSILTWPLAKRT